MKDAAKKSPARKSGAKKPEAAETPEQIEARHAAAISALLEHPTVREAARASKLSEETLYRYRRDPAFAERYREARRALIEDLQARLQAKAEAGARVLSEIAEDKKAPASARVTAARALIENAVKLHEQTEITERLAALEKILDAQKKGGRV